MILQAMEKFFAAVYAAILRHLPFQTLRAIVIASPGFTRESVRWPSSYPRGRANRYCIPPDVRLCLPASHRDDEQTPHAVPVEMGQSA